MRLEYQADNKYNQSCKNNQKKIYHTRTLSISKNTLHQPHPLTINQNTIHLPLELKNRKTCTPQHSPTSKYSLVRTKFSTVSDDDQSHHHSGMNKNCKNFIYTLKILNNSLFSHTHSPQFKHSPNSKTLTQFKNTIHLPLELKNRKTCTPQHYSAHTQTHLLQNTHWWEQSSQLILVRTKFSTVSDDDQSHHHSGMNKIVKILFIHSKYWTIHCSLTHIHPIQTLTKILLEFTI